MEKAHKLTQAGGLPERKRRRSGDPAEQPAAEELTRRNFLQLGLGALGALAALETLGAGFSFLRSRSLEGRSGSLMVAGAQDNFPTGSVTEFTDGNFFLVRAQDGGFLAVYRRCPHLGCTVNWVAEKERFYCPCHASSFDVYGNYDNQPVPRALDTFPVSFDGDTVMVDTSQLQRRESFEPRQLSYK
ncbi:MAG: Rieske (2Fe-2S) protein [Chloroflexi bacterium]|nr:Rieske (2Fe-2S) protein [Chloroflexota bacterium]